MFVELHMIQNFAPSCLNRDDTNSPKDCEFGGFRRARISSQCLKRSIRQHPVFAETVTTAIGIRTKRLIDRLTADLAEAGNDAEIARGIVRAVVEATFSKLDGDQTAVALYVGENEIARLRDTILENWEQLQAEAAQPAAEEGNKKAKKAKSGGEAVKSVAAGLRSFIKETAKAPDIALFGRMVAEAKDINVDAACQVAHALSTHKAAMEMDFFTAVDDLQAEDESGAGMMGTVEFNSSCFYRYALIDTAQLQKNLDGDDGLTRSTVEAFIRAAVAAIPTGKQNSMAAQNRPSFVFAVVRDGGCPASLANAFEEPVRVSERTYGLVNQSVTKLIQHRDCLTKAYGETDIAAQAFLSLVEPEAGFGGLSSVRVDGLEQVIATVTGALPGGA